MTARSSKAKDKPVVSVPVIVVAVAILILILGAYAWHFFGPNTAGGPTRALTAKEQSDHDWVQQKAKQTNGDFEKLSPEDQRRLISIFGPKAPFAFKMEGHSPQSSR